MIKGIFEFYFEMMSREEQIVYRAIYDGLLNMHEGFVVPRCEYDKLGDIFEKITDDHPEIFYVKSIQIQSGGLFSEYRIIPEYRFDKEEVQYINSEVEKEVEVVLRKCRDTDPFEIEKMIHDYLVGKATYKDVDAPYSHEMPGVFLYGIGVCEGMAKAFKYLCDLVGIRSGIIVGNTKSEASAHAWNQVCIEHRWYNVDVTFDSNLSKYAGDIRYDYFNVTDAELSDRTSFYTVPECSEYYGFYVKKRQFANCQKELKAILRKRHGNIVSVQLPRINCPKRQLDEYLLETISDGLGRFGAYNVSIAPNYEMNVFTVKINKELF